MLYNKVMKTDFHISHNKESYTKPIYFHSHDFCEIYLFADGKVKYYIENESYALSKGDVLVIQPGLLHRPVIESDAPYERYVLWIYGSFLANEGIRSLISEIYGLTEEKNTRLASFGGGDFKRLTALFDRLAECYASDRGNARYAAEGCILLILDEIAGALRNSARNASEPSDLIGNVIAYLNQDIASAPSLDELSAHFFVSKYYLSHRFREHTRTTIHQYILMKKVNLAKHLLENGASPQEVCDKCGFSTYSNFYKAFVSQTGASPREFSSKEKARP